MLSCFGSSMHGPDLAFHNGYGTAALSLDGGRISSFIPTSEQQNFIFHIKQRQNSRIQTNHSEFDLCERSQKKQASMCCASKGSQQWGQLILPNCTALAKAKLLARFPLPLLLGWLNLKRCSMYSARKQEIEEHWICSRSVFSLYLRWCDRSLH